MPARAISRTLLPYARLDWAEGAPRSLDVGDVYFSGPGEAETRHVFLDGNTLRARFQQADHFTIGELGFGSGLNCLCAWDLWRQSALRLGARLHIVSVERAPLAPADLDRAHAAWPALAELAARLRALLPPPVPGTHHLALSDNVSLTLLYGEADATLRRAEARVDAWFLDGFSPAKNPDAWSPEILCEIARLSSPGATFATYTVAGAVRRGLEAAGFTVEKVAGYGQKREMLTGRLVRPDERRVRAPWFDCVGPRLGPERVVDLPDCSPSQRGDLPRALRLAIIGGGIAGASLAHAARSAGFEAAVFDGTGLACGSSGNPAGLIMPRLDLGDAPSARFFLEAFLYTERLLTEFGRAVFNPCGVRLASEDDDGRNRLANVAAARLLPADHLIADGEGLVLPRAGVVDPRAFVAALIADTPVVIAKAGRVLRDGDTLFVQDSQAVHGPFDAVVLANGVGALRFVAARGLPLSDVAGQIDWFPDAPAPKQALAFGPYLAPAPKGGLVIGATYDRLMQGEIPRARREATLRNIAAIARLAPDLAVRLYAEGVESRASVRCQTPDRLPVAGPLPDLGYYAGEFDGLRVGLKRDYRRGAAAAGMYILAGLGSRGLVTAPLLAAMIVASLANAPAPVDAEIAQAVHPARFFIRDLRRPNRTAVSGLA